jgi:hypothetical protein
MAPGVAFFFIGIFGFLATMSGLVSAPLLGDGPRATLCLVFQRVALACHGTVMGWWSTDGVSQRLRFRSCS